MYTVLQRWSGLFGNWDVNKSIVHASRKLDVKRS